MPFRRINILCFFFVFTTSFKSSVQLKTQMLGYILDQLSPNQALIVCRYVLMMIVNRSVYKLIRIDDHQISTIVCFVCLLNNFDEYYDFILIVLIIGFISNIRINASTELISGWTTQSLSLLTDFNKLCSFIMNKSVMHAIISVILY